MTTKQQSVYRNNYWTGFYMITASVMKELIYSMNKQRSGKVAREKNPALWQYLSQNKYF